MVERLQKIIARGGVASRRHAEQLIVSGQVRVNGKVVTELGAKADADRDSIKVAGKLLHFPATRLYLILNKPPGYVASMSDPEGRQTIHHLLRGVPGRVFPVGRLEYRVSGLLLLTSDGELAARLLRASRQGLPQVYWIKLKGQLTDEQLSEAARAAKARLRPLSRGPNPWYEVTLSDARRDVLRKRLLQFGHPVEKVRRMKLGNIELGDLPAGQYRHLTAQEVSALARAAERAGGQRAGSGARQQAGNSSSGNRRTLVGDSTAALDGMPFASHHSRVTR